MRSRSVAPPTVSFAITRIRRSPSPPWRVGAVWIGRFSSPRKKSHQTMTPVAITNTATPSHLLIRAATAITAKYAIVRIRKRNASASLRNGFCMGPP